MYAYSNYEEKILNYIATHLKEEEEDLKLIRTWDIKLSHPDLVDHQQLQEDLSVENPLLYYIREDDKYIVLHRSLVIKAHNLRLITPDNKDVQYVQSTELHLTKWVEWAKMVKEYPWDDKKSPVTIKCILPKV